MNYIRPFALSLVIILGTYISNSFATQQQLVLERSVGLHRESVPQYGTMTKERPFPNLSPSYTLLDQEREETQRNIDELNQKNPHLGHQQQTYATKQVHSPKQAYASKITPPGSLLAYATPDEEKKAEKRAENETCDCCTIITCCHCDCICPDDDNTNRIYYYNWGGNNRKNNGGSDSDNTENCCSILCCLGDLFT